MPDRLQRQLLDLTRWRLIFVSLLIVSLGLGLLFERQARRLEALAEHGVSTWVTAMRWVSQGSSAYVEYRYAVEGVEYTGSVRPREWPLEADTEVTVLYLLEAPSLSRPGGDAPRIAAEAAGSRAFAWKVVAGLVVLLMACSMACHVELGRLRRVGLAALDDPRALRRRLWTMAALLGPLLVLVVGWHASDALARGQSLLPVALGALGSLGVLLGTGWYVLRRGRAQAGLRSARILRWGLPSLAVVAILRLLVGWLGAR